MLTYNDQSGASPLQLRIAEDGTPTWYGVNGRAEALSDAHFQQDGVISLDGTPLDKAHAIQATADFMVASMLDEKVETEARRNMCFFNGCQSIKETFREALAVWVSSPPRVGQQLELA